MVAAGVAKRLDEKVWMDIDGNIVDSKEKAHGVKVDTVLTHPDYVLFVDEVGNNTKQVKKWSSKLKKSSDLQRVFISIQRKCELARERSKG